MTEENGATGITAGIEVTPLPAAPAPASSAGDIIMRHDPSSLTPDQARATLKGLNAHPSMMSALTNPADPAHRAASDWRRAMNARAYGAVSQPAEVDEESGATIAPQSETLTFTVPDSPEGYADSLKEARGFMPDAELQQAAAGLFHALHVDTHTAKLFTGIWNSEIGRAHPISAESRNAIAERTIQRLSKEWGGREKFDARIAELNRFIREKAGDRFPVIQAALFGSTLGVSEFTIRKLSEAYDRAKAGA